MRHRVPSRFNWPLKLIAFSTATVVTRTLLHITCTLRILFIFLRIFLRQWHCARFRFEITSSTDLLLFKKKLLNYFISLTIMYVLNCILSWHPEITPFLNGGGAKIQVCLGSKPGLRGEMPATGRRAEAVWRLQIGTTAFVDFPLCYRQGPYFRRRYSPRLNFWVQKWRKWDIGPFHLSSRVFLFDVNSLTPNDPYRGRTAPLTSKRCILYNYSTHRYWIF